MDISTPQSKASFIKQAHPAKEPGNDGFRKGLWCIDLQSIAL